MTTTIKVITDGRIDVADYFRLVLLAEKKLVHTPVLAFLTQGDSVRVVIIQYPELIEEYPDDTPMMGQWRGNWRSDFFRFTAGEFKQAKANAGGEQP